MPKLAMSLGAVYLFCGEPYVSSPYILRVLYKLKVERVYAGPYAANMVSLVLRIRQQCASERFV